MNLFAHRREYQRSIDRIFEDFSVDSQVKTGPSPEELELSGYEFFQYDVKAYAYFLDSKRRD